MGFLGVYAALYDYTPQSDQEISFQEGDLLYVLEKSSEDEWWKAKRKTPGDNGEEPVGLIPSTYIEEAEPSGQARALYDYTRQTDEEMSLTEDATLSVYDTSDPDWILVGLEGEYGFAPANYIELRDAPSRSSSRAMATVRPHTTTTVATEEVEQPLTPASAVATSPGPAAALASIMQGKPSAPVSPSPPLASSSSPDHHTGRPIHTPDASDDEPPPLPPAKETAPAPVPSLPKRPVVQPIEPRRDSTISESIESPRIASSPPFNRVVPRDRQEDVVRSPGAFHLYNISEMVSVMGKRKKMPTTLGINSATGTIMISPESSRDGPQQEWTGEKLVHYSIEGKHVFMELVRPSKSVDFHAGAKDTAEEIVSALGEIAGAVKAEGLREVLAAADEGVSKGQVLYDFVAQGDDEVTVGVGDQVVILDDTKSDEWWMVRRLKDGKEGVMPSSYVEVTRRRHSGAASKSDPLHAGRSTTEQNRLEEERLAKEAAKSSRPEQKRPGPSVDVGLGVALPQRGSSLMIRNNQNTQPSQRDRRESRASMKMATTTRSKPDASRTRTWTDRSGSFKVEAEFIGCSEGKIHLHKLNGVKIAVPVSKMATQDLEFVEKITGLSLDEDKPLSEIKRRSQTAGGPEVKALATLPSPTKAAPPTRKLEKDKDEYDWFDFFLKCGVSPQLCERYAASFTKDSMDESVLPDITTDVLRTLGLKEGDILKVMKYLDTQFGRTGANRAKRNVSFGGAEVMRNGDESGPGKISSPTSAGGLFSGPGGALRNNTRKGRPAPAIQTKDVVDPKVFEQSVEASVRKASVVSEATVSPTSTTATAVPPPPVQKDVPGFEDDAWDVKPSRTQRSASAVATSAAPSSQAPPRPQPQPAALTGSMKDLSLLASPADAATTQSTSQPAVTSQPTGPPALMPALLPLPPAPAPAPASAPAPNQFGLTTTAPGPGGLPSPQRNAFPSGPPPAMATQPTGFGMQSTQSSVPARLRPQPPPPPAQNQGGFTLPPPPRPLSAPQNNPPTSGFTPPPIQPQLTGVQNVHTLPLRPGPTGPAFNNQALTGQQSFMPPSLSSQPPSSNLHISTLAPQMTGMPGMTIMGTPVGAIVPQPTGFIPSQQPGPGFPPSQPFSNGPSMNYGPFTQNPTGQMMPLSMQATGAPANFSTAPVQQPQPTGNINNFLPPALPLQPQRTGFGAPPTTLPQSFPAPPPIPQQPTIAPLIPQKTGPAPPVRFGIQPEARKLTPQPTGRRANLSQATPQNPFGF